MKYALRYEAPAGLIETGYLPPVGAWLESYDPEAFDGRGHVKWTTDPQKAARFPSQEAAWRAWHGSPRCKPVRADGRPNKPLTAYTMSIVPMEEELGS